MRACRTCLSKYDLYPIFGELEFTSKRLFLATGVKIDPDDGLPQTACKSCIKSIRKSLHLRELSLKADDFLRTFAKHKVMKTELNIEDKKEDIIDPFSNKNDDNSYFDQQNEPNDINESSHLNDDENDDIASDDDIKPVIDNDDEYVSNNEQIYETEFVNIQTKEENVEYDPEEQTESRNCLTLSKHAQIMLYPTKDGGKNSDITKKTVGNVRETTVVLCQSLQLKQLQKKITNNPTNIKYVVKCNADNIDNCRSEICQSILQNKLQKGSANLFDPAVITSGAITTGHQDNVSGQPANISGQTAHTSDQVSSTTPEDFFTAKELNELFKDSHEFGNKSNTHRQTRNISGQAANTFQKTTDTAPQNENTNISFKELRKLFKDRKRFKDDDLKSIKRLNISDGIDQKKHVGDLVFLECPPEKEQDQTVLEHENVNYEDLYEKLMSNLKESIDKYDPRDAQESNVIKQRRVIVKPKMDLNRRKFFAERNKKLMALAVSPYSDSGPIQCRVCHEVLMRKHSFRSHALKHFEKQHVCQFSNCGKRFVHRGQLSRHQQTRHGLEKKFSCARCGFRAVDRLTMQNHIRASHTGEKPFECHECGARFRMRNNIIQHIQQVHFKTNKNLQCEFCPSRYQCRRDLWMHQDKAHFYTHTYYCYLCPNTYRSGCSARKHLLKIHGLPKNQQQKLRRDKIRKPDAPTSSNVKPIVSNTPR